MIRLFEEQERQDNLREGGIRKKRDLALRNRIKEDDRRENIKKIPFQNDSVREDLQKTVQKYYSKKCENTLRNCEESLGQKLGEAKAASSREEKMRQLLWETCPELRELRQQMLVADVTRDQAMQVAEKQAVAELRRREEASLAAAAEEERRQHEAELRRREELEFQAKLRYHKDLDDLREFRSRKEDGSDELQQKERDAIDKMRKEIEEEDREVARRKLENQRELHRQSVELQKVREGMRHLEKEKERSEETRADEYRRAQELRAKQAEEERRLSLQQRLRLQEELLACLEELQAEAASRERLRTELGIEEREAAEREKAESTEARRTALREEMQRLHDLQVYVKRQKEELLKKEEELFRENLLAQLYEEEKLEHMSQQKRRLKQAEHWRIAQELIAQNRRKKETERAREKADDRLLSDLEKERLRLVEEERRRFLGEHAKDLLGYLPKGVFRDEREIERLGEDFKKFYSRTKCSSLYQ